MSASGARERRIGWACALAVLAVWVAFQIVGRVASRQSLTPWDVTALRHIGAFLAVLPIVLRRGLPRIKPARGLVIVATSALGFPIGAYVGFSLAPVALGAVILFGALPIVTVLIGWAAFGQRPTARGIASLPVIAAGIGLIGADTVHGSPAILAGALWFMLAVACLASFTQLLRRWRVTALDGVTTLSLFGGMIFLPVWWLFLPSTLAQASWTAIVMQIVVQGVVTAVLAMFLYSRAVFALGAGPPTLVASMVPGMASVGAWWLLGERLGPIGVAGVAAATAGMLLGVLPRRRRGTGA